MEKFTLEILYHIIGIGSASGLFYQNNSLYIIGDNSGFLYEYHTDSKQLDKHALVANPTANTPKQDKADFEAMAHFGDTLYIFGSGSTAKRTKMVEFNLSTKTKTKTNDLVDLYAVIQNFSQIQPEDFNVEGAIFEGENWYLFNRGNGISNKNAVFTIHAKNLGEEFALVATNYKLPKIKGIRSSFTDAVLVGDKIYFLATVENSKSTYEDGEVLGSFVGRMDLEKMKIDFTQKISSTQKFEGITFFQKDNDNISFLLCEDNDTDLQETRIYQLNLPLKQ